MSDTLELRKIEELLTKPPENIDVDVIYTNNDRDPAWFRFLRGAYDMPITWWTGIIHCTMLAGTWGRKYKAAAQNNQQRLDSVLEMLASHPDRLKIIKTASATAWYNNKYISGRFAGGVFVTKVTSALLKKIPFFNKYLLVTSGSFLVFNFGMSSYGAGLLAVGLGYTSVKDIVYSMLTGTAQRFPIAAKAIDLGIEELKTKSREEIVDPDKLILIVEALNDIQPVTGVSYEEWCKDNPDQAAEAYFCQ